MLLTSLAAICRVLFSSLRINVAFLILLGITAIQLFSMLSKRYVAAFRLASVELVIPIGVLFFSLYPPIPGGYAEPLLPFGLAFWVWLLGGSALTTAAWVCHKAAKDIKYNSPTQHITLKAELKEYFLPLEPEIKEYLRPWKLITFAAGLAILIGGALYYKISDWDIGISLIMGTLTYIAAPRALYIVKSRHWRKFLIMFFVYWFTVDGSYMLYNAYFDHPIGAELRRANFFASSLLYLLCGLLWSQQMTLREFLSEFAGAVHLRVPRKK